MTPTHPSPPAARLPVRDLDWPVATWVLLVVVCGALFLDGLDLSMVGVALPSIGKSLHLHPSSLQWIVSGYVLGYGGLLLLGGRTSDLLSRRTVFLTAVSVFALASVVSAFMSDDLALVALRFVKGASAGFTVPAGLSILTTTFAEGPARNRALGIYTLCGASGFSLGLVFGGLLTELGWRATFLVPGPVAVALVVTGWRVIPRSTRQRLTLSHFDLLGAVTSTASLLLLVYTVVEAPGRGWLSAATIGCLALAAALMAAFVIVERRHPRPLLRLGILRSGSLVHANICGFAMYGSYAAFQFLVTLYVQDSLGWSPLSMALAFLPTGIIVVLAAPRTGALLERFATPVVIAIGFLAFVGAYALFLRTRPSMPYADFMLPTMILLGVGFGLTFASLNAQATAGVSDDEQGLASGLLNTSLQIGGAVVLAVVTAVVSGSGRSTVRGQLLPGMTTAIWIVVGITGSAFVLTGAYLYRESVSRRRQVGLAPVPASCELAD